MLSQEKIFVAGRVAGPTIGREARGRRRAARRIQLAERVGFEPTWGCPLHAFQACALSL